MPKKRKFFVLALSAFAVMLGMGIIAPLMPLYAENLGASGIWLGIIFASYSVSRLLFVPIIGKMSDSKGRKNIIAIGLFLYSLFSLAYVFAYNEFTLSLARFLQGFASAMTLPIIMAVIGDISPKGKEGRYMGYFNVSRFFGMGLGPMLGGGLNDVYGINSGFYVLSGLTALTFVFVLLFLKEEPSPIQKQKQVVKQSYKKIWSIKIMRGLLIFRFVSAMGRGSILSFLAIYAFSFGITAFQVGVILMANIVFLSFLQIPFGKMADKVSKMKMIMIGGAVTIVSLLFMPSTGNFYWLLLLNILWGTGRAMSIPATSAINTIEGRKFGMGSAMGLFMSALYAGMIIAPLISGVLMETIGIKYVFYFSGLATFAGVVIFYSYARGIDLKTKQEGERTVLPND
ncbi:MAG: MFS transporter [Bacteroidales bacterium]|nr:MFS transporter [Bacteroidales bacterium]